MDNYKIGDIISCNGYYYGLIVDLSIKGSMCFMHVLNLQSTVRQLNILQRDKHHSTYAVINDR